MLLHDFMYGGGVMLGHLVELVDAADTLIGQHQRAALQHHLSSQRVLHHSCRQAHS